MTVNESDSSASREISGVFRTSAFAVRYCAGLHF